MRDSNMVCKFVEMHYPQPVEIYTDEKDTEEGGKYKKTIHVTVADKAGKILGTWRSVGAHPSRMSRPVEIASGDDYRLDRVYRLKLKYS